MWSSFVVVIFSLLLMQHAQAKLASESPKHPNIILLLTDDQDVTAKSLDYMPKLNRIMRKGGMEFVNAFVPTALCCPSRVGILRGQYCHNHKIWDNGELNGMYPDKKLLSGGLEKIMAENLEDENIATLMRDAGYETFFMGKYVNGYENPRHVPPGWDHWYGMLHRRFYGSTFSNNGEEILEVDKDVYQTDFISMRARDMIQTRDKSKPFFMYLAPYAPHAPATPAKRHEKLFKHVKAPRFASFNPDDDLQQQKPSWIKTLPKLSSKQIDHIDEFYRNRLRSLQAVDEMLADIIHLLKAEAIKDSTYLFYMGDNGQHMGDYRFHAGKRQAYDTDIRVPFLVVGPGVPAGTKVTEVVMSIDLLPTWLDLAHGKPPLTYDPDGKSIVPLLTGKFPPRPAENTLRSAALAELYGGSSNVQSDLLHLTMYGRFWNNTYQAVRVINGLDWAKGADWLYVEWCTGEKAFYNVTTDKHQVHNTVDKLDTQLLQKLSTLTEALGKCAGKSCSDINYAKIAEESLDKQYVTHVKCHNPPDVSVESNQVVHTIAEVASNFELIKLSDKGAATICKELLGRGFPYSDAEQVPESELEVWDFCLNMSITE